MWKKAQRVILSVWFSQAWLVPHWTATSPGPASSRGFVLAGTLPGAFRHPTLGYVDAYVMVQELV